MYYIRIQKHQAGNIGNLPPATNRPMGRPWVIESSIVQTHIFVGKEFFGEIVVHPVTSCETCRMRIFSSSKLS